MVAYSFRNETAYWQNNWGNIISTIFYTLTLLVFINFMTERFQFSNGLDRNMLLVIFLFYQIGFYVLTMFDEYAVVDEINSGRFDYYLIRPWNIPFAILGTHLKVFYLLRDAIIPLAIIFFSIDWAAFVVTFKSLLAAALIFTLGVLNIYLFRFMGIASAFWIGQAKEFLKTLFVVNSWHFNMQFIPVESYRLKSIIITFIGGLVVGRLTALALVSRLDDLVSTLLMLGFISLILFFATIIIWKKAIRTYSSASS